MTATMTFAVVMIMFNTFITTAVPNSEYARLIYRVMPKLRIPARHSDSHMRPPRSTRSSAEFLMGRRVRGYTTLASPEGVIDIVLDLVTIW